MLIDTCSVLVYYAEQHLDADVVTKESQDLMSDLKEARQKCSQLEQTISTSDTKLAQQQKLTEAAHYRIVNIEEELKSSRNDAGSYL